ncbi:MAG: methyltransferase, partial [Gemmatimonadetes bacterium]|nr:methyltransferase [Gemmatimonadota bacterium]
MNSRERVLKALRHQEPDRVPLDCGACRSSTISAVAYGRLKRRLGILGGTTALYDVVQHQAMPEQWYLDRFGVDVVDVTREYCLDTANWRDWELPDGQMARMPPWIADRLERDPAGGWVYRDADGDVLGRMPRGGYFFDQVRWPLMGVGPDEYRRAELYTPKG